MTIDNMEEVKSTYRIQEYIYKYIRCKGRFGRTISKKKDDETIDYLHELELGKLKGFDVMRVANDLIRSRKEKKNYKE